MKLSLLCSTGCEPLVCKELEAYKGVTTSIHKSRVDVECSEKLALQLCYELQTVERVLLTIVSGNAKTRPEIDVLLKNLKLPEILTSAKSFEVRLYKRGESELSTTELEPAIGEHILNAHSTLKVDLSTPAVSVAAYACEDEFTLGIDLGGMDLSKRDYKIYASPNSIKGTIGACLLHYCDYTKKEVLLDPFIGDGVIAIEAAFLTSKRSHNCFRKDHLAAHTLFKDADKQWNQLDVKTHSDNLPIFGFDRAYKYVDFGKKNAKIAGVDKQIKLTKVQSEDLDLKFEKGEVSKIITKPPERGKSLSESDVAKLYTELFYQADFVLKKKGIVGVIMRQVDALTEPAKKYGFVLVRKHVVFMGEQKLYMAVFARSA